MDPDLQDDAWEEYQGRIPRDALEACAPFWIRQTKDHSCSPTFLLMAQGPSKWIKVSTYDRFVADCKSFAAEFMRVDGQNIQLRLVIQPYTPLADAYNIYKHLFGLEMLPSSFAECVELLKQTEEALAEGKDVDDKICYVFGEYNRGEDHEEMVQKEGSVSVRVNDKEISVQFLIANHNLLFSKARKYSMFMFLRDSFTDLHSRVRICQKLIKHPTSSTDLLIEPDYDKVDEAKKILIFSMYQNSVDPHYVIAELYNQRHDEIYGFSCPLCGLRESPGSLGLSPITEGVGQQTPNEEDMYDPHELLLHGLQRMGYDTSIAYPPVEDAQRTLIYEYGFLEAFKDHDDIVGKFFVEAMQFSQSMESLVDQLELIMTRPTVIGVPSYFDGIEEV